MFDQETSVSDIVLTDGRTRELKVRPSGGCGCASDPESDSMDMDLNPKLDLFLGTMDIPRNTSGTAMIICNRSQNE